jgi:hypothetical protein
VQVKNVISEVDLAIQHLQNVKLVIDDHSGTAQANLELIQAAKAVKRAFRRVADLIVDEFDEEEPAQKPPWFP